MSLETMIVYTRWKGVVRWYSSAPDYWVLDQRRWSQAFEAMGYPRDEDYSSRFDIPVVSERTADEFLTRMVHFLVSRERLRDDFFGMLPLAESWFDIVDFVPRLVVDFDRKALCSIVVESWAFEKFVPDGWEGSTEDFFERIDPADRYWIADGVDHLEKYSGPVAG